MTSEGPPAELASGRGRGPRLRVSRGRGARGRARRPPRPLARAPDGQHAGALRRAAPSRPPRSSARSSPRVRIGCRRRGWRQLLECYGLPLIAPRGSSPTPRQPRSAAARARAARSRSRRSRPGSCTRAMPAACCSVSTGRTRSAQRRAADRGGRRRGPAIALEGLVVQPMAPEGRRADRRRRQRPQLRAGARLRRRRHRRPS